MNTDCRQKKLGVKWVDESKDHYTEWSIFVSKITQSKSLTGTKTKWSCLLKSISIAEHLTVCYIQTHSRCEGELLVCLPTRHVLDLQHETKLQCHRGTEWDAVIILYPLSHLFGSQRELIIFSCKNKKYDSFKKQICGIYLSVFVIWWNKSHYNILSKCSSNLSDGGQTPYVLVLCKNEFKSLTEDNKWSRFRSFRIEFSLFELW